MGLISNLPILSGEFIRGYTKAICDTQEIFETIYMDLCGRKKRINMNMIREILSLFLTNREKIRENRGGFIRYNTKLNGFEFYEPNKKNYGG